MTGHVLGPGRVAPPGSPEHLKRITASKIPSILGIDPYRTQGDLWMEMSGLAAPEEPSEEMRQAWAWGHAAEESLARWWQAQHDGWTLNAKRSGTTEIAYADDSLPFPNQVTLDRRARSGSRYHRLEIKTSASEKKWGSRDAELPGDVAAQTIFQAGVSGIAEGTVIALIGADRPQYPRVYDAPADQELFQGMVDAALAFYRTLGEEEPPAPDPALLDALKAQQAAIDDDDVTIPQDVLDRYQQTKDVLAEAKDDHEQSKQELAQLLGNHKRLIDPDGQVIVTQTPGRFSQRNVPDEYAHLLKDPEVMTPKLDTKKLKSKYPDLYHASTGPNTVRYQ